MSGGAVGLRREKKRTKKARQCPTKGRTRHKSRNARDRKKVGQGKSVKRGVRRMIKDEGGFGVVAVMGVQPCVFPFSVCGGLTRRCRSLFRATAPGRSPCVPLRGRENVGARSRENAPCTGE